MAAQIRNIHSANREKIEFAVYAIGVAISAFFVADMLGRAWRLGHVSKIAFLTTPRVYLNLGFPAVTAALFGFYLGLLLLLLVDVKKRWQGIILIVGTALAIVFLQSQNLFIFNVVSNSPWLALGIIAGVIIGGGRKLGRIQTPQALEFRRASQILLFLLIALCLGGWLEAHVSYPKLFAVENSQIFFLTDNVVGEYLIRFDDIGIDTVSLAVFIAMTYKFVQYDAERSFLILGPSGSGKTLFVLGAYLDALQDSFGDEAKFQTPMNPTNDLIEMIDLLDRQNDPWIVSPTEAGEVRELAFRFVQGRIFPLNVYIRCLDYAGEYLVDIPDFLTGMADFEDHPAPAIIQAIVTQIQRADTLVLLIDVERYMEESDSLEIAPYFDIIQAVSGNKEIILAATKCDLLADRFREERGLEPYRYYDEFVEYVNEELQQSEQIRSLIRQTAGSSIHPVYYQTTTEDEDGRRVPMRDESGSVMVVGFDEMRKKLA